MSKIEYICNIYIVNSRRFILHLEHIFMSKIKVTLNKNNISACPRSDPYVTYILYILVDLSFILNIYLCQRSKLHETIIILMLVDLSLLYHEHIFLSKIEII